MASQRLGRPRDTQIDGTVLAAAREMLTEVGFAGVTMDAVAARAGVGKAAIYRRFGSKAELLFAAAVHGMDIEPPPDTGSLRGDIRAMAGLAHERLSAPAARVVTPALMTEMGRDPALVARFQDTFIAQEHKDLTEIVRRAEARGELPPGQDPTLAHLLLGGPLFLALFAFHHPVDGPLLDDLATVIAEGLIAKGREG
ncbi:TetR/AcrR family transcriptional regulator [Streptomyces sp. NPDC050504]|uniref:TetR/AcrR family transcriptional regulator n=1 Tax=Streptomyces sp. NPDC050504 TaxID=3365618 RepID=UPI003798C8C9